MKASRRRRRKFPREPFETTVEDLSHDGRGVATHEEKKVFIHGGLPGERVAGPEPVGLGIRGHVRHASIGSGGRARTYNLVVNSHPLCRLSYRGTTFFPGANRPVAGSNLQSRPWRD